jgi:hypothetical protein
MLGASVGGSHDCDSIVVEDGGDVFRREFVGCVTDEKAGLADGTVTNDNASESSSPLAAASNVWCSAATHFIVATAIMEALELGGRCTEDVDNLRADVVRWGVVGM